MSDYCSQGCGTAGCVGSSCGRGCTGCSGGCQGHCTGCSGGCAVCYGSCKGGCSGDCGDSCGGCTGTCSGGCSGSCKGSCLDTCLGKCNTQCKGSEQDTLIINLPDYPINRKIFASDIIPLQKAIIYQCERRKVDSTTILCKESLEIDDEDINKMINDLNKIKINSIPFKLIEGQKIQAEEFKTIKKEIIDRYNEFVKVD